MVARLAAAMPSYTLTQPEAVWLCSVGHRLRRPFIILSSATFTDHLQPPLAAAITAVMAAAVVAHQHA